MESQPTTPTNSLPKFDDAPIVQLLGLNPSQMDQQTLTQFVQRIRQLRAPVTLASELNKESESLTRSSRKSNESKAQQVNLDEMYGL